MDCCEETLRHYIYLNNEEVVADTFVDFSHCWWARLCEVRLTLALCLIRLTHLAAVTLCTNELQLSSHSFCCGK